MQASIKWCILNTMGEYRYDYPRPALTVDVVVFSIRDQKLNILLIKRLGKPYEGTWALPGGFIQLEETLREAALRELKEESGIENIYIEQLYTYGDPDRDPRGRIITVAYLALLPANQVVDLKAGYDASEAGWFPLIDLPTLAFDHAKIISYAVQRLRRKLEYSAVGFELLPDEFTLSEIQHVYEVILGSKLDKRNFRRRILEANIIEATKEMRTGEGRPARLFRYKPDAIAEVKARRLFP